MKVKIVFKVSLVVMHALGVLVFATGCSKSDLKTESAKTAVVPVPKTFEPVTSKTIQVEGVIEKKSK